MRECKVVWQSLRGLQETPSSKYLAVFDHHRQLSRGVIVEVE